MSSVRGSGGLLLAVLGAAAGLFLVGLPWVPVAREAPLPARFSAADPGFARVGALLTSLDAAIEGADVAAFRAATTAAFVRGIERRLHVLDRRLNRAALQDWAAQRQPGEFARLARGTLQVGVAAGARAAVVFEDVQATGSRGPLVGIALDAAAGDLRLDAVRVLAANDPTTADRLATDLLQGARP
jgi:hypothetical protein